MWSSRSVFPRSTYSLSAAAHALGRLNETLATQPNVFPRSLKYRALNNFELAKISKRLQNNETEFAMAAKKYLRDYHSRIVDFEEELKSSDLPRQLLHADFHPLNAVFRFGKPVGIFDFDSIVSEFRMQSVAFACSRLPRPWCSSPARTDTVGASTAPKAHARPSTTWRSTSADREP